MGSVSDTRPLKVKALECAVISISRAITPDVANIVYKKWSVFHDNATFKNAVNIKKMKFKTKVK